MQSRQTRLRNSDGHLVFVRLWTPDAPISHRAVLHISHGMAEHSQRYEPLADVLTRHGIVVVAHDHRGHGHSMDQEVSGHYADEHGWEKVCSDVELVRQHLSREYPDIPYFLLGHSMGSFIATQYLINYQPDIAGFIMSGSNYSQPLKYLLASRIAKLERLRQGKRGKSMLIWQLTFGSFNDRFKPTRTANDWLSRDPNQVDLYNQDSLCGFDCTNQLWIDFLDGLYNISQPANLRKIRANLPIYVFGGSEDPVGQHGKGLRKLVDKLRSTGHRQVEFKIYEGGRHETLNETNRKDVIGDLHRWLENQISHQSTAPVPISA